MFAFTIDILQRQVKFTMCRAGGTSQVDSPLREETKRCGIGVRSGLERHWGEQPWVGTPWCAERIGVRSGVGGNGLGSERLGVRNGFGVSGLGVWNCLGCAERAELLK